MMSRRRRNCGSRAIVEPLEPRIAPATLLDARALVFTDADGDRVTVRFSKDVFVGDYIAQLATANAVFKFDSGSVNQNALEPQQLQLIDLTKLASNSFTGSIAAGAHLTVSVETRPGGDGQADIGAIRAAGIPLGKVTIAGDLGQIDAGNAGVRIGVAALTVHSLGARGIDTQIPVPAPTAENPAPDLVSTITGELTALKVLGDVQEARLSVLHGRNTQGNLTTLGNLGSISIGGSLLGRAAIAVASDQTGFIEADGNIGSVKIGTVAADGIVGGGGKSSGRVSAGGTIGPVTIAGSVIGGDGLESGMISSAGGMGSVTIGGDLAGGAGEGSGVVRSFGNLGAIKLGGDLVAGAGAASAVLFSRGAMTTVLVGGDVDGSAGGAGSAGILGSAGIAKVTVLGGVIGGANAQSGFIESGRDLGPVKISGDVTGGAGAGSGAVFAHGKLAAISIAGDLTGGAGALSGLIRSGFDPMQTGDMGKVVVLGAVEGGGGDSSGAILAGGALKSVAIGKKTPLPLTALTGGAGAFSGSISANGTLGAVKILGGVQGGGGDFSGALLAFERTDANGEQPGNLGVISIAGPLVGGSGASSGALLADGALKKFDVGSIEGGAGAGSASVQTGRGLLSAGDSGAIRILGAFREAGAGLPGAGSATIDVGGNLASLFVGGETLGAAIHVGDAVKSLQFGADVTDTMVTARGQVVPGKSTDVALGRLTVKGAVAGTSFLAGYDAACVAVNPDAQIGAVSVKGSWTASNLVAGVAEGADPGFGNAEDALAPGFDNAAIVARIASVVIGGAVSGSAAADDHFGFVAQVVGRFKSAAGAVPLGAKVSGEVVLLDAVQQDVAIREIAVA